MRSQRHSTASFALLAALAAALCAALAAYAIVGTAAAGAAPTLTWSAAVEIDQTRALTGVACASRALCVAVDGSGHVLIGTNPAGESWSAPREIDPGHALTSVSCAPASALCVAADNAGGVLVSTNSGAGWSERLDVDATTALTAVSCASASLCVAVDEAGNALLSTAPALATAGAWSSHSIDSAHALTAVSCTAGLPCVAVDGEARGFAAADPAGAWVPIRALNANASGPAFASLSCAPAPAGFCVAAGATGNMRASANPAAGETSSWNATPVAPSLTGVSCAAGGLCAAVADSDAYIDDNPTAPAPEWKAETIDSSGSLSGVSCVAEGLCAAVDSSGHVLVTTVSAPAIVLGAPSAIGETTATLNGTVNTNDALTSCRFEYGTSEAYGQNAPCPALSAGSASQPVSATLSALAANVTYDYRLVAVSASGEQHTANATFKTAAPALVHPHPSISGLPAPGQRLTCKTGLSSEEAAHATLTYQWLRNTKAIGGAAASTYLVASADVSHHLQCRITATNAGGSATATSAFVTVPAGGLGAISETQVGSPRVAGRTVSVPVTCSAQAAGSCTIKLRLTVLESIRRGHVVGVAARRTAGRTARAAARTTHKTATVGATTAHLPAGHRGTVTVALNATGKSLLKRLHRLTAKLSVSGTVVGAISAQLRSATVTFGGATKASARHRR